MVRVAWTLGATRCHVPVWRLAISLVQRRISGQHALDDAAEIRDRNRRREGVKERGTVEQAGVVCPNGGQHQARADRCARCVIDRAADPRDNRAVGVIGNGVRHDRAIGAERIVWRVALLGPWVVGLQVAKSHVAKSDGLRGMGTRQAEQEREQLQQYRPSLLAQCGAPFQSLQTLAISSKALPAGRFATPWSAEDNGACFIIRDHNGQALAYVYYEEEPGRRSAASLFAHQG